MSTKLLIKLLSRRDNRFRFFLFKGAQLDASIITPKRLIELQNGIQIESDIEDKTDCQVLKSVMGECTDDITGTCTLEEAVQLIRALNHKQELRLVLSECGIKD